VHKERTDCGLKSQGHILPDKKGSFVSAASPPAVGTISTCLKRIFVAYYRIKPRWRDTKPKLTTPPATEALRVLTPDRGMGYIDIYQLQPPFVEYIRRLNTINGSQRSWEYIAVPNAGIFNYTRNPDGSIDYTWYEEGRKPFLNTVGFDGNVVNVIEVRDDIALVQTIDVNKYVPLYTYLERPDLVHQFTTVNNQGRLFKAGNARTVYSPLLTRSPSVLPLDCLEPFPTLPVKVIVEWPSGVNVRKLPGVNSTKLTAFPQGREVKILRYHPRGAEVWGQVYSGYICLFMPSEPVPYSTTWKMQTSPPPL